MRKLHTVGRKTGGLADARHIYATIAISLANTNIVQWKLRLGNLGIFPTSKAIYEQQAN